MVLNEKTSKERVKKASRPKGSKPHLQSSLDESLGYLLRRAQIYAFQLFGELMANFDLRPPQYAVIVLAGANPGLTQSAVSSALGIQRANFVAMIDQLESRGILERRRVGGDRRSFALHLTAEGETLLKKLNKVHATYEKQLSGLLGPRKTGHLVSLLHEFNSTAHSF